MWLAPRLIVATTSTLKPLLLNPRRYLLMSLVSFIVDGSLPNMSYNPEMSDSDLSLCD